MQQLGKLLIIPGILLVLVGGIVYFGKNLPFFGKLPGDIRIERSNFKFYFPLATCLIVSLLLSLILFPIARFRS